MLFPVRQIGSLAKAVIITPRQDSSLAEPWLNIQTGETAVNVHLGQKAVDELFALAGDLQRALDFVRMRK